jgi:hypothetical protein
MANNPQKGNNYLNYPFAEVNPFGKKVECYSDRGGV